MKNLSDRENGKLAFLTSGRPAFQQHAKRTEGSDTTPRLAHSESTVHRVKNSNITKLQKDHAAQRGRDAFGTATRISASLSRRLSASFWRTPGQDPKTAKFAALSPGHAGFPKRAERSEGSDTTPHPKHHLFRRVCPCVRFFSESRVCTHFHS